MVIEQNPYACLGLMPGAPLVEIKRCYRQLAKQYHPDCNRQATGSEEKLRDLNAAYAFLSDPVRKASYDAPFKVVFDPAPATWPAHSTWPWTAPAAPACRRRESLSAIAGLAMLLLISTGVGVLFTAANASPSLAGLWTQSEAPQTADVGTDHFDPAFSFIPTKNTFVAQSSQP